MKYMLKKSKAVTIFFSYSVAVLFFHQLSSLIFPCTLLHLFTPTLYLLDIMCGIKDEL